MKLYNANGTYIWNKSESMKSGVLEISSSLSSYSTVLIERKRAKFNLTIALYFVFKLGFTQVIYAQLAIRSNVLCSS